MTDAQQSLFAEPHWTDAYPVGTRVRELYMDLPGGTVATNDGARLTVDWVAHPTWGDWTCTYGSDHLLERLPAPTPEGPR